MKGDPVHILRDALAEAAEFARKTPASEPRTLAEFQAASALGRLPSLLRSILVLVERDDIAAHDIDVLVRVLVEMAITAVWVRADEDRAAAFRDYSVEQARKWREAMERQGFTLPREARVRFDAFVNRSTGKKFPDLARRAEELGKATKHARELYDFSYRRLSSATHHDFRVQALMATTEPRESVRFTLHDAATATMFIIASVAETLGTPGAAEMATTLQQRLRESVGT